MEPQRTQMNANKNRLPGGEKSRWVDVPVRSALYLRSFAFICGSISLLSCFGLATNVCHESGGEGGYGDAIRSAGTFLFRGCATTRVGAGLLAGLA
jgi:hypothetical protein